MGVTCAQAVCCFVVGCNVLAAIAAAFFLSDGDGVNTNDESNWRPDEKPGSASGVQTTAPAAETMEAKKND